MALYLLIQDWSCCPTWLWTQKLEGGLPRLGANLGIYLRVSTRQTKYVSLEPVLEHAGISAANSWVEWEPSPHVSSQCFTTHASSCFLVSRFPWLPRGQWLSLFLMEAFLSSEHRTVPNSLLPPSAGLNLSSTPALPGETWSLSQRPQQTPSCDPEPL